MKKIIISLMFLIMVSGVFALSQPMAVEQPDTPGTSTQGECEPYEISNGYCNGNIRHYDMCVKTASGGVWQPFSENCKEYGSNVNCVLGKCRKQEEVSRTILYTVLSVVAIIALIAFLNKGRGKR